MAKKKGYCKKVTHYQSQVYEKKYNPKKLSFLQIVTLLGA